MLEYPMEDVAAVTTAKMREVDRLMVEVYQIGLSQMVEHAGRHMAELVRWRFFDGDAHGGRVHILAGTGGNGGGGLVSARRLLGWGAHVSVTLLKEPETYTGVPGQEVEILRRLGVPMSVAAPPPEDVDVVIDALVGYGLQGRPRGTLAALIEASAWDGAPIVSLDVPSGLDATTGEAAGVVMRAAATLAIALPKAGLVTPEAAAFTGELYLADIGVPPQLYRTPGLDLEVGPLFSRADLIHLTPRALLDTGSSGESPTVGAK
ncbi:MAG: NAD(P)H-hydrate epimerase [Thermoleophilia bacterium]